MNIFWLLLGVSPFFGWWWMYFGWWWVVVGGGGYILAGGGWWWMVVNIFWLVVGGHGQWWMGMGGDIVQPNPFFNFETNVSKTKTFSKKTRVPFFS